MALNIPINLIIHLPDLGELYLELEQHWNGEVLKAEFMRLVKDNKMAICITPKFADDQKSYILEPSQELLDLMAKIGK